MIKFRRIDDLNYLKSIVFPQFKKILDDDDDKYIAVEEDNNKEDVIVMFIEQYKVKKIIDICKTEDIIVEHRDLTQELIENTVTEEIILRMIKSDEYSHLFKRFFSSTKFKILMN